MPPPAAETTGPDLASRVAPPGEGRVLLRNKRGKTRTYEPATAAGGIEGGDAAESAALLSDGLPKANPLGLP